jgi:5-(aminomethyl)-3-furanmethanol phosphate kinase
VIVVKVGGSLYDLPDLSERLRRFLATLTGPVLVFPGGGITVDAIRELDRVHGLGDEASHWLALAACAVNGRMLATLLGTPIVDAPTAGVAILDPYRFAVADEARPGRFPHRWDVTSDSMSARAAAVFGASELVLLKSVEWPRSSWADASAAGVVDPYFPTAIARLDGVQIRVVAFRRPNAES